MTKQIRHELTYEAPLGDVAAMLGDPAFREEVCAAQRVQSCEVTIEPTGAGPKKVSVVQQQDAQGLPSFAAKFVGDSLQVVQEESWSTAEAADISVTFPGKPAEMTGTLSLRESGGTTTETVTLEVKVKVPLVGGKVEGLVADMLVRALKAENRVGRDYLSR